MDKLEVGEWYRDGLYLLGYYESVTKKPCFHVVYDLIYTGNDAASSFITEGLKPLETLTPREALILLGNRFELKKPDKGLIYKMTFNGSFLVRWFDEPKNWESCCLSFLQGFTIHALPKEAGENENN